MPENNAPLKVFISYASLDHEIRKEMETHLAVLIKNKDIEVWADGAIGAGSEWKKEIYEAMDQADIFLLCVTNNFLASDFINNHEISFAFKKQEEGGAAVVPVILRPCDWTGLKIRFDGDETDYQLGNFQALPYKGKPVYSRDWYDKHEAYADMAKQLKALVRKLRAES